MGLGLSMWETAKAKCTHNGGKYAKNSQICSRVEGFMGIDSLFWLLMDEHGLSLRSRSKNETIKRESKNLLNNIF